MRDPLGVDRAQQVLLDQRRHLVEADLDHVGLEPAGELRRRLLVGVEGRGLDLQVRVRLEHRVDQLGDDAVLVGEHAQRPARPRRRDRSGAAATSTSPPPRAAAGDERGRDAAPRATAMLLARGRMRGSLSHESTICQIATNIRLESVPFAANFVPNRAISTTISSEEAMSSTETATEFPSVKTELPGPAQRRADGAQRRGHVRALPRARHGPALHRAQDRLADRRRRRQQLRRPRLRLGLEPARRACRSRRSTRRSTRCTTTGFEITDYVRSPPPIELAERLVELAPASITRAATGITGTEVVEGAVKLAREATGRPMILGFLGQYHGEATYLTAAGSTDLSEVTSNSAQYVSGLVFAPYPNQLPRARSTRARAPTTTRSTSTTSRRCCCATRSTPSRSPAS